MRVVRYPMFAAILSAAGLFAAQLAHAASVDEALQLSQKTGRAIFAMAGSKNCGACQALEKRLVTDPSIQPLIASFIPLKIDTDGPEWQTWATRFKPTGNTIPMIFVVRADGEQLYGQSNNLPGAELPTFLTQMLQQTGAPLPETQVDALQTALLAANKALSEKQVEKAIQTIGPCLGTGSYAQAAVEIEKLARQMCEEGSAAVKEADAKFADPEQAFDGALQLAALERTYAKLPPVVEEARNAIKLRRREPANKDLLAQAKLLDQAKAFEEKQLPKRALASYQTVATRYAGKPAGELAQARIAELEQSLPPSTSRSAATPARGSASSELAAKKAASLLKMGKGLLEKRPEKAREYLAQVVELAPESAAGQEARTLLQSAR
ncbi:MAG: thioredoxin family protein [Planctomycetaceae bacterium]|nr:thioredoxin family protein [Planctomycetaceae bacterium]